MTLVFPKGKRILALPGSEIAEPSLPSKREMAVNLARAVAVTIEGKARGENIYVDDETAARRLEACRGCEFFRASDTRCAHAKCGCRLSGLLSKTKLKHQRCPDTPPKW